jgi:hypothetical protein
MSAAPDVTDLELPPVEFLNVENIGRSVNAGAKGIRILGPIAGVHRKKDEEAEKEITKQNTRVLLGFRNAYVFDISQTREGGDLIFI